MTGFAGSGVLGHDGDGAKATAAKLNSPFGLVRGPDGAVWFCEFDGQLIRRVAPDGTITTVAGTGRTGYTGDGGPAKEAAFNQPHELRFDRGGNLFIADTGNHAIRRLDAKSHVITIFAGTGKPGTTPDGSRITGTPLNGPRSLDFDTAGNLWLATREGNQVFRFDLTKGVIQHVAGNGKKGFTGNGGPAKDATLSGPKGIAVAPNGDVFLADTENNAIRKIDSQHGTLELVLGTGEKGDGPDGDPLKCRLNRPHGVWVDPDGSLFVGDSENHRLRGVR